jgi:hypothetical protein
MHKLVYPSLRIMIYKSILFYFSLKKVNFKDCIYIVGDNQNIVKVHFILPSDRLIVTIEHLKARIFLSLSLSLSLKKVLGPPALGVIRLWGQLPEMFLQHFLSKILSLYICFVLFVNKVEPLFLLLSVLMCL